MTNTEYKVIKNANEEIFIAKESDFEKRNFCDCYTRYGVQIGCSDAGCYSLNNSESTFKTDLDLALKEKFGIENFDYEEDLEEASEEVKKFASLWIKENESHTEVTAATFWNGHDLQSLILKTEIGEPDLVELEDEEADQILNEFSKAEFGEDIRGIRLAKTENYTFSKSRFQDDPWIASVE